MTQITSDPVFPEMDACRLCARSCGARRNAGHPGVCGMTAEIRAGRAALHMWEEPCISGREGSGAVFFTGCPLRCVFCQNRSIALGKEGVPVTVARVTEIFLELAAQGANNINLVTPTHYVPQIVEAVRMARAKGLSIPILYNTGSYETRETIRRLQGTVDIFLPDLKYKDPETAARYSRAPDYFAVATAAIEEMVTITGPPRFDDRGMLLRGTIVRHMVLPGHVREARKILEYLHETYGNDIYVSIMNQYTPMEGIGVHFPELGRRVTRREYDRVVEYALSIGIENAYIQEGPTAEESFIPSFHGEGVLKQEVET